MNERRRDFINRVKEANKQLDNKEIKVRLREVSLFNNRKYVRRINIEDAMQLTTEELIKEAENV